MDKPLRDYLDQVARNVSLGGLFVDADHPPPVGTLVKLELRLTSGDDEPETILVSGLVRWRQRWSQPRGMGIEFIDFEGLGERDFKEWLETVLEPSDTA